MNRQFTGYILKGNKSSALPRHIVALKTEVIPQPLPERPGKYFNRFRLGVAVSARYREHELTARTEFPFSSAARFWEFLYSLSKPTQTTWLVGHNILFDLRHLGFTDELTAGRMSLDSPRRKRKGTQSKDSEDYGSGIACIQQPPTIIGFRCGLTQGRIIAVDLMNWFPENLCDLGKLAKWDTRTDPLPHDSVMEWYEHASDIANAILGTFGELMKWTHDNDFGMFRYTSAAQSMAAFRHRFMRKPIYLHDNLKCKKHERAGYYGGRTECYYVGGFNFDVWQLDVQSMYPSQMAIAPVPTKLIEYVETDKYTRPVAGFDYANSIAAVTVNTDEAVYPLRRNGGTIYPIGAFQTVLAGSELYRAYRADHILAVASYARYETDVIFTEFVDTLWAMRKAYKAAGNDLYDAFAKKLLNSLYGKWAQLSEEWQRCPDVIPYAPWTTWIQTDIGRDSRRTFRSFGWATEELVGRREMLSSFPAVSAFITAAARCRMNALRCVAGEHNILYQGSDALLVTREGYRRLDEASEIRPGEIGKLRIEYRADRGHIYGPNDYLIGDKQVIAGRAGKYVTIADSETLYRKAFATSGLFSGSPQDTTGEHYVTWRREATYTRGTIAADGRVSPLELGEGNGPIADSANDSSEINCA
jgi:hypothetical protein